MHDLDWLKRRARQYEKKCRDKRTVEHQRYLYQYYTRTWRSWITRKVGVAMAEDRNKARESNITGNYITKLFELQNQRCCLSGLELTHDKSLYSLSIDRIDNSIGHMIGNVQLTSMGINLAKNYHSNDDIVEFIGCVRGREFTPVKRVSRDYISTCLRNARPGDLSRGRAFDVDTDYVLELLSVNGRCALSGVVLAGYKHPCFSISVDRIDSSIGHVRGNVQLVCKAINRARGKRSNEEVLRWIQSIRNQLS